MGQTSSTSPSALTDPISNVLKWILLAVAVVTFGLMDLNRPGFAGGSTA
jgi:hypothetical protein